MVELEPTVGTRDFYPEDMRLQRWLFDNMRETARLFGFQEYDCPLLEEQELYVKKAGEAGEEILEQMYSFTTKDGYRVALRPEMTPSFARLVLKKGRKLLMPIRWYSIPQCWRFENMQRGRKREHYQWNMDIMGVAEVTAEAELIASIVCFFKRVGLTASDVGIKINSRNVLFEVLTPLGITEKLFAPVCVIVDKLDKLDKCEVERQLTELGIKTEAIEVIQKTLGLKSLEALEETLPNSKVVKDLKRLFELCAAYDCGDWVLFDASVVRGLAYYTGIVFEAFDRKGVLRAICGGGRYNKLLSTFGANEDIPSVGFGFGDCVIIELLKEKGCMPPLDPETDDIVVAFNEDLRPAALQVAAKLRGLGRSVDVQLIPNKKMQWCYTYADRVGAKRAVLIAPTEWSNNEVRIKLLRLPKGEEAKEYNVKFEDLQ
jgi:histidyl-tRNA synthetase